MHTSTLVRSAAQNHGSVHEKASRCARLLPVSSKSSGSGLCSRMFGSSPGIKRPLPQPGHLPQCTLFLVRSLLGTAKQWALQKKINGDFIRSAFAFICMTDQKAAWRLGKFYLSPCFRGLLSRGNSLANISQSVDNIALKSPSPSESFNLLHFEQVIWLKTVINGEREGGGER